MKDAYFRYYFKEDGSYHLSFNSSILKKKTEEKEFYRNFKIGLEGGGDRG